MALKVIRLIMMFYGCASSLCKEEAISFKTGNIQFSEMGGIGSPPDFGEIFITSSLKIWGESQT